MYILKVSGWLIVRLKCASNEKVTVPMFLSRLNEISGGRGNMCLVSDHCGEF